MRGRAFLLVADGGPEAPQADLFRRYGAVRNACGPEDAVRAISVDPRLTAACVVWSIENGRLLRDVGWAKRRRGFSLLVVCPNPTREIVQQVFRAQEVGCLEVRLACSPVLEEDLRTFIEASIERSQAARDEVDSVEHARGLGVQVGLTPRELQVLQLAMAGIERRSIAGRLQIAPSTLRSHVRTILGKFTIQYPARTMAELVNVLLRVRSSD